MEAELKRLIGEVVDLTIGTSAGALIAAAIAHGVPAVAIADAFRSFGPQMFPASGFNKLRQLAFKAPYVQSHLQQRSTTFCANRLR